MNAAHEGPLPSDASDEYTNRPNKSGFCMLHTVIDQNDYRETPLMMSIRRNDPTLTIMQLIEAGCDINIADFTGKTPLHMAIYLENLDIAHELIKRGADVNACSCNGRSSLFYAIISRNVEIICMLLYYGIDVTIQDEEGLTALTYHMKYSRNGCACEDCIFLASLLIPYYDDFNYTDKNGYSPLYRAFDYCRKLGYQLLDLGADVHGIVNNHGKCYVFDYGINADLLKRILPKLDCNTLLNIKIPFLFSYFQCIFFPKSEWLEYLYLILQWPIASDLLHHFLQYWSNGLSHYLMRTLFEWDIEWNHRTNIISICLTFGVEATITELDTAIRFFGFKEEFEMLLYAASNLIGFENISHPLLLFILGIEDFNKNKSIKLIEDQIIFWCEYTRQPRPGREDVYRSEIRIIENCVTNCLNFFSISYTTKQNLTSKFLSCLHSDTDKYQWVVDKINGVSEFPSLLELSRNQAHKFFRETHEIKRPYNFMDAVQHLALPQIIKDIIVFKEPIY